MSKRNLDVVLDTFERDLESALSCLKDGQMFYEKVKLLEKSLLDASPKLVSYLEDGSIDTIQIEKIKNIIKLIETLELKSNAKLNWFQDLDKHLKRSLAKEV